METEFTPFMSLLGGVLIGLSAVILMGLFGRVMGATGILAGFLMPASRQDWGWRAALLAGMATGPFVYFGLSGGFPAVEVPVSTTSMIIGGLLVGAGVTYGGGCTSGHGVCGIARLSPRSITATVVFMICALATVYVVRHLIGGAA